MNTRTEVAFERLLAAVDAVLDGSVRGTAALDRARCDVIKAQAIEAVTTGLRYGVATTNAVMKFGGRQRGVFWIGWQSAVDGDQRSSCSYEATRGGFRGAWMAGFDCGERDLQRVIKPRRRRR